MCIAKLKLLYKIFILLVTIFWLVCVCIRTEQQRKRQKLTWCALFGVYRANHYRLKKYQISRGMMVTGYDIEMLTQVG